MPGPGRHRKELELIYDWNEIGGKIRPFVPEVELLDETLREGLQNPSVRDPKVEEKLALVELMAQLGIHWVNLGLPASSQRAFDDCLTLCREITARRLKIQLACAGRTMEGDIAPIIELSQRAGVPIAVYAFVGSSPIRALAEEWDLSLIRRYSAEAIDLGVRASLPVTFVTEDTSRSRPEVLAELFQLAVDHGASRLCLCDTVGHATPDGVKNLIQFTRSLVASMGAEVGIDWHGHNDRGLALANALYALKYGADRVHGTALGLGERVGNAPMELLALNLKLLGVLGEDQDLTHLRDYCLTASHAFGWEIPINYPLIGRDAFRTATGVHAAAIRKAQAKGRAWLADRIYSGVPAGMIGRTQEICIGHMSGASNVVFWLQSRGIEPEEGLVRRILAHAKASHTILDDEQVLELVRGSHPAAGRAPGAPREPYDRRETR
ncbi:MAG TPA: 2-isopropylmalate synthase [Polyangiaceae bacterium]|nr:2-isopropylmalate synthase [Polyangiaceae bacterium]